MKKILIEREGAVWKLTIVDNSDREHKLPNNYSSWKVAVNHLPYVTLTDRGYKVALPDSHFATK